MAAVELAAKSAGRQGHVAVRFKQRQDVIDDEPWCVCEFAEIGFGDRGVTIHLGEASDNSVLNRAVVADVDIEVPLRSVACQCEATHARNSRAHRPKNPDESVGVQHLERFDNLVGGKPEGRDGVIDKLLRSEVVAVVANGLLADQLQYETVNSIEAGDVFRWRRGVRRGGVPTAGLIAMLNIDRCTRSRT